jgi:hypothetical protein
VLARRHSARARAAPLAAPTQVEPEREAPNRLRRWRDRGLRRRRIWFQQPRNLQQRFVQRRQPQCRRTKLHNEQHQRLRGYDGRHIGHEPDAEEVDQLFCRAARACALRDGGKSSAVNGNNTAPQANGGTANSNVSGPGVGVGHAANGRPIGSTGSGLGSPENPINGSQ